MIRIAIMDDPSVLTSAQLLRKLALDKLLQGVIERHEVLEHLKVKKELELLKLKKEKRI